MGGSSKSSSSATSMYDQRVGAEDSIVISHNSGSSITMTDGGAIKNAFDFAGNVVDAFESVVKNTNDTISRGNQQVLDSVAENTATVLSATKSEQAQLTDKLLSTSALVALGYFALKVIK